MHCILTRIPGKSTAPSNDGHSLRLQALPSENNLSPGYPSLRRISLSGSRPITPRHTPLPSIGIAPQTNSNLFPRQTEIPEVRSLPPLNLQSLAESGRSPTFEREHSFQFRDDPLSRDPSFHFRDDPLGRLPSFRDESSRRGNGSVSPLPPVNSFHNRTHKLGDSLLVAHSPPTHSNNRSAHVLAERTPRNRTIPAAYSESFTENLPQTHLQDTVPVGRHSSEASRENSPQTSSSTAAIYSAGVLSPSHELREHPREQQLLLAVRLPDGAREELIVPASATLADLFARVRASGEEYGMRDMSGGPRAAATGPLLTLGAHGTRTLTQLGLRQRALVVFVPRDDPE